MNVLSKVFVDLRELLLPVCVAVLRILRLDRLARSAKALLPLWPLWRTLPPSAKHTSTFRALEDQQLDEDAQPWRRHRHEQLQEGGQSAREEEPPPKRSLSPCTINEKGVPTYEALHFYECVKPRIIIDEVKFPGIDVDEERPEDGYGVGAVLHAVEKVVVRTAERAQEAAAAVAAPLLAVGSRETPLAEDTGGARDNPDQTREDNDTRSNEPPVGSKRKESDASEWETLYNPKRPKATVTEEPARDLREGGEAEEDASCGHGHSVLEESSGLAAAFEGDGVRGAAEAAAPEEDGSVGTAAEEPNRTLAPPPVTGDVTASSTQDAEEEEAAALAQPSVTPLVEESSGLSVAAREEEEGRSIDEDKAAGDDDGLAMTTDDASHSEDSLSPVGTAALDRDEHPDDAVWSPDVAFKTKEAVSKHQAPFDWEESSGLETPLFGEPKTSEDSGPPVDLSRDEEVSPGGVYPASHSPPPLSDVPKPCPSAPILEESSGLEAAQVSRDDSETRSMDAPEEGPRGHDDAVGKNAVNTGFLESAPATTPKGTPSSGGRVVPLEESSGLEAARRSAQSDATRSIDTDRKLLSDVSDTDQRGVCASSMSEATRGFSSRDAPSAHEPRGLLEESSGFRALTPSEDASSDVTKVFIPEDAPAEHETSGKRQQVESTSLPSTTERERRETAAPVSLQQAANASGSPDEVEQPNGILQNETLSSTSGEVKLEESSGLAETLPATMPVKAPSRESIVVPLEELSKMDKDPRADELDRATRSVDTDRKIYTDISDTENGESKSWMSEAECGFLSQDAASTHSLLEESSGVAAAFVAPEEEAGGLTPKPDFSSEDFIAEGAPKEFETSGEIEQVEFNSSPSTTARGGHEDAAPSSLQHEVGSSESEDEVEEPVAGLHKDSPMVTHDDVELEESSGLEAAYELAQPQELEAAAASEDASAGESVERAAEVSASSLDLRDASSCNVMNQKERENSAVDRSAEEPPSPEGAPLLEESSGLAAALDSSPASTLQQVSSADEGTKRADNEGGIVKNDKLPESNQVSSPENEADAAEPQRSRQKSSLPIAIASAARPHASGTLVSKKNGFPSPTSTPTKASPSPSLTRVWETPEVHSLALTSPSASAFGMALRGPSEATPPEHSGFSDLLKPIKGVLPSGASPSKAEPSNASHPRRESVRSNDTEDTENDRHLEEIDSNEDEFEDAEDERLLMSRDDEGNAVGVLAHVIKVDEVEIAASDLGTNEPESKAAAASAASVSGSSGSEWSSDSDASDSDDPAFAAVPPALQKRVISTVYYTI